DTRALDRDQRVAGAAERDGRQDLCGFAGQVAVLVRDKVDRVARASPPHGPVAQHPQAEGAAVGALALVAHQRADPVHARLRRRERVLRGAILTGRHAIGRYLDLGLLPVVLSETLTGGNALPAKLGDGHVDALARDRRAVRRDRDQIDRERLFRLPEVAVGALADVDLGE